MGILNRKNKSSERGAALLNVLLITTFVMVLVTTVLAMAMNSLRLKNISLNSKNNFYTCEAALDQIKAEFRNEMEGILLSSDSAHDFITFYQNYRESGEPLFSTNESGGNRESSYCYDIEKLARLVTNINGNKVTNYAITRGNRDAATGLYNSKAVMTAATTGGRTETVTLQSVDQTVNNFVMDTGYVLFRNLTVTYVDAAGYESQITTDIRVNFPEDGEIINNSGDRGWVSLLDDRVKPMKDWNKLFEEEDWKKHDFGSNLLSNQAEMMMINTTDYPANTVTTIQYTMPMFQKNGSGHDNMTQLAPWVQMQDGRGTGAQYQAAMPDNNLGNVYVFVGSNSYAEYDGTDMTDEELYALGWARYDSIFAIGKSRATKYGNPVSYYGYCFKKTADGKLTEEASKFVGKYHAGAELGESYTNNKGETVKLEYSLSNNPRVRYMIALRDKNNMKNSRGWIAVQGMHLGPGEMASLDKDAEVRVYVNLPEERTKPVMYYNSFSKGASFFDDATLTKNADGSYTDKNGNIVSSDGGSIKVPLPKQSSAGGYYHEMYQDQKGYYLLYTTGDTWNKGITIAKVYLTMVEADFIAQAGGFNVSNSNRAGTLTIYYYNGGGYKAQAYNNYVYIDASQSGYRVGDKLKLTLKGVYADKLMKDDVKLSMQTERLSTSSDTTYSGFALPEKWELKKVSDTSVEIIIPMTWNTYPYFDLYYNWARTNTDSGVSMEMDWIGSADTPGSTITIPGSDAFITYSNWRKE